MNSNFTQNLDQLEKYSLSMIDFFSQLPDSFFDDPMLQPSQKIVDSIIKSAQKDSGINGEKNKLFRFAVN